MEGRWTTTLDHERKDWRKETKTKTPQCTHSLQQQINQQCKKKMRKQESPATQQVGPGRYRGEMFITEEENKLNQMQKEQKEEHVMHLLHDWEQGEEWGHEFLCQHGEMCIMYCCVWVHMLPLHEGRVPCEPLTACSVHLLRILGFESKDLLYRGKYREKARCGDASLPRELTPRKMQRESPLTATTSMETIKLPAEISS